MCSIQQESDNNIGNIPAHRLKQEPKYVCIFLLKQLKNRSETYLVQIKVDANIFMGLLTSLYNSLFAADFTCLGFQ